jgi:predicted ATP-grasp superfamily ATP-dependent carboligase
MAVPAQWIGASAADLRALAARSLPSPLVLKPSRSVVQAAGGVRKLRVCHVADAAGLRRAADEFPAEAYPVLVQQRIVGPGIGIFLLLWNGQLRAQFAHRRIREKPPSGGVSVYSESVAADPELVAQSRRLLDAFSWNGVAMVEYKRDAASGIPYLMEINGRFWGSLQLAVDAGVDFPSLLLDCSSGAPATPPPPYRMGQRLRWFWGDVDHLLSRLRRSSADLSLPPDAPGRMGAVRDFLTAWRPGQRCDSWRLGDPAPFWRESAAWYAALRDREIGARA